MTQRERYLAAGVGALVLLLILNVGFKRVIGSLNEKEDRVDRAFSELQSLNNTIRVGTKATDLIRLLETKSLPSDHEAAVAQYTVWVSELAKDAGMQQIKVTSQRQPQPMFPAGQPLGTPKAYDIHEFTLSGQCRLDQVIELLSNYYDRDYLHKISSLKLTPTRQPNVLAVELTSKAVSLAKASPQKEPSLESSGRMSMSMNDYKRSILERNPFSAPNQPPVFTTRSTHDATIGQNFQLKLEARDPEGHSVAYELVSDPETLPESLTFENSQLQWKPTEKGEQRVVVKAVDDGWPSQSSEMTLVLRAVEAAAPPAKTPTVDPAQQAYLTGLVTGRGGAQGWIRSRAEDLSIDIYEGAEIKIGSISARVIKINVKEDYVELETDGERWTVDMNVSLAEAFKNSKVD